MDTMLHHIKGIERLVKQALVLSGSLHMLGDQVNTLPADSLLELFCYSFSCIYFLIGLALSFSFCSIHMCLSVSDITAVLMAPALFVFFC